jgi:hypothetical protein
LPKKRPETISIDLPEIMSDLLVTVGITRRK